MSFGGISGATVYAQQKPKLMEESDLLLIRLIDEEYTRHPSYGLQALTEAVYPFERPISPQ